MADSTLAGRTVAVPEARELDVFAAMLERRGAKVLRCPLVAILDAPDSQPVLQWIGAFNASGCDDLILLTGEGLRRLLACIDRHDASLRGPFIRELALVRKITRGPKPARALRELGLKPDIAAEVPTTPGVIESLRSLDLTGHRVGVQLYGSEPNLPLIDFLRSVGAQVKTVAPYIYASKADDQAVLDLLASMTRGEVDLIAFTSKSQVDRLFATAPQELVQQAFAKVEVAAVGPVVRDALTSHSVNVRFMPDQSFFMKPLTSAMEDGVRSKQGDQVIE